MPDSAPETTADRRRFLRTAGLAAAALAAPMLARPRKAEARNRFSEFFGRGVSPVSLGEIVVHRLGFGPRLGQIADFNALGATDDDRLSTWLDLQLADDSYADLLLQQHIDAAGFTTLDKSLGQLWQDHVRANPSWHTRVRPYYETERMAFLRATYSNYQLKEVLADFWHNHFNIYAYDSWAGPTWVHYDRDVIRGNMLGNFRTMLEDVAKSPAMLYYLDNYTNTNSGPNENFARELFELHGLGAENYFGVMPQDDVPVDGSGRPLGYVDIDVFEATRCLTGWTLDNETGAFFYRSDWHDRFQKRVLGTTIAPDQAPEKDGKDVLDLIAAHPGTGRFVARKLCRRLIADDPPQSVVDAAAAVFTAHWQSSDQLERVARTIILSDEFKNTWGEKVKRPFDLVVQAMRATDANVPFTTDDSFTNSFFGRFEDSGHRPFRWNPPDGYPDEMEAWLSNSPLIFTWRCINWMFDADDDSGEWFLDVAAETPASKRSANEVVDYWIARVLGRTLSTIDRQTVVNFMANGINPDFDLPIDSDQDTNERLQSMVALLCISPDAHLR